MGRTSSLNRCSCVVSGPYTASKLHGARYSDVYVQSYSVPKKTRVWLIA
jgi:hypothetical protein